MPFFLPAGRLLGLLATVVLLSAAACRATTGTTHISSTDGRVSEAEAAGLLLLAGNAEVSSSRVAAARTYDAGVLAYAARVRTDHASMNAALIELIASARVDPVEGTRARALRETSADRRARLEALTGRALDIGYIDATLQSQRELLALLDVIQPGMARSALREHAAALRPVVAAHAAHAEQLRATLTARE